MSLKTRLRIVIVALVVGVAVAVSALALHSVATSKFQDFADRARVAALQMESVLRQRVVEQAAKAPPPQTLEETKALWSEIVEQDVDLTRLLEDTMAGSLTIYEISITGEDGRVLASSSPLSVGKRAEEQPSLAEWMQQSHWRMLLDVLTESTNYAVTIPLGIEGQQAPVFEIRVIVHSALLRNTIMPEIQGVGRLLAVSVVAAILLAILVSNLATRPLSRISEAIDRIARGEFAKGPPQPEGEAKELAAVTSKLNVLGQQFRGAKEDAVHLRTNIEQLLERLEEAVLLFDRNDRLIMAGKAAEHFMLRGRWDLMGCALDELFPASTPLGAAVQGAVQFRRSLKDHAVTLERDAQAPSRLLVNVELLEDFPSRERLGTLVTLRDAETRRQIGTQLDLSTRLASISRLTGGVAHEIKNPLNAIALHLEVLRSKIEGKDAGVEPQIEIISREIARLNSVVKTFLDFTRPLELVPEDLDLADLAREAATLVQPEAEKSRVTVGVEADPHAVIRGDRNLLKQAVLNVVMNGIEAMKNGGRLQIQVRRVNDECVFGVSDEGTGIPPEARKKIFNLYFTTKGKGSGIGLAMTFRIVQLHNGSIDFASEPNKGTTFWLRFPGAEESHREAARAAQEMRS